MSAHIQAIDPVCGMTVDPATAAGSLVHEGITYYFCNPSCLKKFQADPHRYVDVPRGGQPLGMAMPSFGAGAPSTAPGASQSRAEVSNKAGRARRSMECLQESARLAGWGSDIV